MVCAKQVWHVEIKISRVLWLRSNIWMSPEMPIKRFYASNKKNRVHSPIDLQICGFMLQFASGLHVTFHENTLGNYEQLFLSHCFNFLCVKQQIYLITFDLWKVDIGSILTFSDHGPSNVSTHLKSHFAITLYYRWMTLDQNLMLENCTNFTQVLWKVQMANSHITSQILHKVKWLQLYQKVNLCIPVYTQFWYVQVTLDWG